MHNSITARPSGRGGLDTTKIAIIYARQSTPDQVAKNIYSTEGQLQLREHALRDGFPDDQVLIIDDDLGVSGRTIAGRVGMSRALKLMEKGLVAIVYAEDMTRLTRDEDTVDHMIIARHCKQSGALLFMGGTYLDMRNSGDRQLFKYQAVGASEGWSQHLEKLHRAQRRKAEEGRIATQPPKWGYKVNRDVGRRDPNRDKLIVHEPDAAIIRALAHKLLEAGSLRELYRQIDPAQWSDGSPIRFRTMSRVLTHPIYRGHYAWHDVLVENAHEAIIGPELAAAIDQLLAVNKTTRRKEATRGGGVLVGLTWCPECDRKIYGSLSKDRPEYRCARKHPTEGSFHFSVRIPQVDEAVMRDLWAQIDSNLVDRIIKHLEGEKTRAADVVDFGEANRRALQRRLEGLTKSLADPDITDAARKVLLAQLDEVARELDATKDRRPVSPHIDEDLRTYRELIQQPETLARMALTWEDEPLAWRRDWVRRFVERVEVVKSGRSMYQVTVHYRDGHASKLALNNRGDVTSEELALVARLLKHPKRPERRWTSWIQQRLEAHGYKRTLRGVYRLVDLARAGACLPE